MKLLKMKSCTTSLTRSPTGKAVRMAKTTVIRGTSESRVV